MGSYPLVLFLAVVHGWPRRCSLEGMKGLVDVAYCAEGGSGPCVVLDSSPPTREIC